MINLVLLIDNAVSDLSILFCFNLIPIFEQCNGYACEILTICSIAFWMCCIGKDWLVELVVIPVRNEGIVCKKVGKLVSRGQKLCED